MSTLAAEAGGWEQGQSRRGARSGAVTAMLAAKDCSWASEGHCGEPGKGTALGYPLEADLTEPVDRLGVGGAKQKRTQG